MKLILGGAKVDSRCGGFKAVIWSTIRVVDIHVMLKCNKKVHDFRSFGILLCYIYI